MVRSQGGDASALDELVRRWTPRLLRHVRLLTHEDAAWDVTQEIWLAIVKKLADLDEPGAFPAWAFRIAHGKSVDWVRKQQRRRRLDEHLEAQSDTPDSTPLEDPRGEALAQALKMLPTEGRALISLYYFEGLTIGEIAEALGIPVGTVKSRLHHCRIQLRRTMEEMHQ